MEDRTAPARRREREKEQHAQRTFLKSSMSFSLVGISCLLHSAGAVAVFFQKVCFITQNRSKLKRSSVLVMTLPVGCRLSRRVTSAACQRRMARRGR